MSTYRDSWLKQKPARKLGLNNKKLVLPTFSYPCGESRSSLQFNPNSTPGGGTDPGSVADFEDLITIEAWIKIPFVGAAPFRFPIFCRGIETSDKPQHEFSIEHGHLFYATTVAGVVNSFADSRLVPQNEWIHVALVWDGSSVRFYINGEPFTHAVALVAPVDALGAGNTAIGNEFQFDYQFRGYINEVRVWESARTYDEINGAMHAPRNTIDADGIDDDLKLYCKCKALTFDGSKETDSLVGDVDVGVPNGTSVSETEYFPLRYGASFVVVKFDIDLGQKCSFKFPVSVPSDVNHSLVIKWVEDDGTVVRRYLYKPIGVDYDASIIAYSGECINTEFTLEIWNVDGNPTVDLEEDLNLKISLTTQPATINDTDSEEAATLAANTELAEPFPWVFPLTFNTQQTYPT